MPDSPTTPPPTPPETLRCAYLGPESTFTETAVRTAPGSRDAQAVPMPTVDAALAAVRAGEVDRAMVPIENSVEGGVTATLDALATGEPLVVVGEVVVPITFVLAVRAGTTLADVTAVGTHPHAWAQVRGWMAANLPQAAYVPTLSTASCSADLSAGGTSFQAAVTAPVAAQRFGLSVLAADIGDNPGAVTRFVLVGRPGALPGPTGADKTTVVLYQTDDHPGGLLELLEQFAVRGINMTRLESRPTGESLGRYCFSIDFEGHVRDERVGEALMGLRRVCADVVFLGSYPRADGLAASVRNGQSDADYVSSRAWLRGLRD